MNNTESKKYRYINLTLIAVYCGMFIKSLIDGRFVEYISSEKFFNNKNLIAAIILFLVFSALLSLIAYTFCKFKLLIPYVLFAIISVAIMLALSFSNNDGGMLSIIFHWYDLIEFCVGALILVCFPAIFVLSLLVKWCYKKFANRN